MEPQHGLEPPPLTGRIQASPSALIHEEVLEPQFNYESRYLLRWYIWLENVLLLEYERMGLLRRGIVVAIGSLLSQITPEVLVADPKINISDIVFAIEQYVEQHLTSPHHTWHVDRSRNDVQACAQLMCGRDQLLHLVEDVLDFAQAVFNRAESSTTIVMPGYTHYQLAQVISPGFYLTALLEQILGTLRRLLTIYDGMNECPLGAGAMAGQQLLWNRHRMAELLGFAGPVRHALVAVASRDWQLHTVGELSVFSSALSRFVTDFIAWGSSEYGFIEFPDTMVGISSAMPQKKNLTLLERIRGKTAHITSFYVDVLLGQRSTAYTNLVEISKEAGSQLISMFTTMRTTLGLFKAVMENVQFREDRMRAVCEREYIGGFTLANLLTLHAGIPYRMAQVITGQYVTAAIAQQLKPSEANSALLHSICRHYGYEVNFSHEMVQNACNIDHELYSKQSMGSTNPKMVQGLLALQREEIDSIRSCWEERRVGVERAYQKVQSLIGDGEEGVVQ